MMRRLVLLLLIAAGSLLCGQAYAQRVTDGNYRTVAHIKSDGTIQDGSYRTIGHIKSDGTVQDGSYRTIGHADGIPQRWAAYFFFFR